jgi:16S rRNA (cytosine1402-N4)-methyltransferase
MALTAAQACLAPWNPQVEFHQINFADFSPALAGASHSHSSGHLYDGILADLGVSSAQFDLGERGFSFRYEAPLDMRMDSRQSLDAAQIINHWEEAELADIFYRYGEERLSRRIARMIVEKRPFATTTQLADAIAGCVPAAYRKGRIHPATRSFQGLRIAVNRELDVLEQWLDQVADWLAPGGRLAVISFHSLEDRLVKHRIKQNPKLQVLTKKPVTAQPEELAVNWRSRSAKLRIAQRLDDRPGALDLEEGEGDRETSEKSWKRKKAATIDWRNGQ